MVNSCMLYLNARQSYRIWPDLVVRMNADFRYESMCAPVFPIQFVQERHRIARLEVIMLCTPKVENRSQHVILQAIKVIGVVFIVFNQLLLVIG